MNVYRVVFAKKNRVTSTIVVADCPHDALECASMMLCLDPSRVCEVSRLNSDSEPVFTVLPQD